MKSAVVLGILLIITFVDNTFDAAARGQIAPPPRYSGLGSAGAWMGRGPMFDFDDPWGKDFPWGDDGGGSGGGGGDWIGYGGYFHPGPDDNHNEYGCDGNCLVPSWTGPCIYLCMCRPWMHHNPGDPGGGYCEFGNPVNADCPTVGSDCMEP